MSTTSECPYCRRGIDHCHGTLVRHRDGTAECTAKGCADLAVDRHHLAVECVEVAGGCACAPVEDDGGQAVRDRAAG